MVEFEPCTELDITYYVEYGVLIRVPGGRIEMKLAVIRGDDSTDRLIWSRTLWTGFFSIDLSLLVRQYSMCHDS
jgi:hypothetical protein